MLCDCCFNCVSIGTACNYSGLDGQWTVLSHIKIESLEKTVSWNPECPQNPGQW